MTAPKQWTGITEMLAEDGPVEVEQAEPEPAPVPPGDTVWDAVEATILGNPGEA